MVKNILVKKANGETEPFSTDKIKASLTRSGADPAIIEEILNDIAIWVEEQNSNITANSTKTAKSAISTKQIYNRAFSLLRRMTSSNAARYKLKSAMMEMGPTGHPFEHFMGQIYKTLGYEEIEVAQTLQGHCLTHEVDVVATKSDGNGGHNQHVVECKYYQSNGKNAGVQVSLYVHSRMEDIFSYRKTLPEFRKYSFTGGVATHTRFSSDAIAYGEYAGLKLISWDYPKGEGLREIIDRERIFPVTVLTTLTRAQKELLMDRGIVICRQLKEELVKNSVLLNELSLSNNKKRHLQNELNSLLSAS